MNFEEVPVAFRERYSKIHPLLVRRSVEKAKSMGDLFDILEQVPDDFPLKWSEGQRRWVVTGLF